MSRGGRRGALTLGVAGVLVAALVNAALLPAGAQSETDRLRIDEQIESTRSQVTEASAEEARLLGEIDASTARKRQLDGQVAQLDGEISVVQRNLNAAEIRLSAAEAEQRGAEARLMSAQEQLAIARAKLQAYAIAAYTGQSDAARYVEAALHARSMSELVAKRSYMKAVATTQTETIAVDERLRDEVRDLRDQLIEARREADAQRSVVNAEQARLQAARDAEEAVRSQVVEEIATTDDLREEAVSRKVEFEAQIEELEQESAAIEATLKRRAEEARAAAAAAAAATTTTTPAPTAPDAGTPGAADPPAAPAAAAPPPAAAAPSSSTGLVSPIPGAPIWSPFGPRIHPIYGDARMHTGVDMGASEGTPIRAAGSGLVVDAGWMGGYGNATIIEHGDGLATLYAHQSSMGVSAGQRVSQGQVIGRVGCTGSCTGPHLHFEVREDGAPVNPLGYI